MAFDALELQSQKTGRVGMSKRMLHHLQERVMALEDDLRRRREKAGMVRARLQSVWREARDGERTRATCESWREEDLTRVAVAWVLAGVFVRYREDSHGVDDGRLAGSGDALTRAVEAHDAFFRRHLSRWPTAT